MDIPNDLPRSPTVVLLHSSGSSARQWLSLAEALRPRYEVIPVELHGHGERAPWGETRPLSLADDAALVEPLLERAGGVHLVGHSYGAAVALKVAMGKPGSVLSLVGYEPTLFRLLIEDDAFGAPARDIVAVAESIREGLMRNDASGAAEGFVDFWSGAGEWQSMPDGRRNAVASRMPSVLRHFDALMQEPLARSRLARLGIPMLLLEGARTVDATRRIAHLLRAAMPFALHETLPEMGHMGPITHAASFNRRVAAFLHATDVQDGERSMSPGRFHPRRQHIQHPGEDFRILAAGPRGYVEGVVGIFEQLERRASAEPRHEGLQESQVGQLVPGALQEEQRDSHGQQVISTFVRGLSRGMQRESQEREPKDFRQG